MNAPITFPGAKRRAQSDAPFMRWFFEKGPDRYWVWREGWPNDQYETLTQEQFAQLTAMCVRFEIKLARHDEPRQTHHP